MTVEQLRLAAEGVLSAQEDGHGIETEAARGRELARALLELFGISHPCGFDQPIAQERDEITGIIVTHDGTDYTADEARGIGVGLMRAADDADAAFAARVKHAH